MRVRLYYLLKPYLPLSARLGLRRIAARRRLKKAANVWPILEAAGTPPERWPGWPDGRGFSVILSHDVEGPRGLSRVPQVAEIEMRHGFRSSFNFVPEGTYRVPDDLRLWLVERGFEIGVHDLHHDGKLYSSRRRFQEFAGRINHYCRTWKAVGFRSGFMLRNLDWIHDLDIRYDASTFDTDPFEPQPDGVGTIFPFWVPPIDGCAACPPTRPGPSSAPTREPRSPLAAAGYAELPYTLVQDLNLFVVLGENSIDTWRRKIDWIASRGGMVHLDTHPDYMAPNGTALARDEFDARRYEELLTYLRETYRDRYWHVLPKEMAAFVHQHQELLPMPPALQHSTHRHEPGTPVAGNKGKIWIDLDNTPHVPFFAPIIKELERRGYTVVLTARDAFQVAEMAELKGLACQRIGRHHGKNRLAKVAGLFLRAAQLAPVALREKPLLAVSHGARSQIIISNLVGIPTVLLSDYEHAQTPPLMRPTWELMPEAIPAASGHTRPEQVRHYPGIKEDVYAWTLEPRPEELADLGIQDGEIVVVVRPPATEAHYHNPESERLFAAVMEVCTERTDTRVVLLPRNRRQMDWVAACCPGALATQRVVVPERALDGLNLVWHADLVVSGGGTMNREAAALGVPVYSIFRGPQGAVDRSLESAGRLTMIRTPEEVRSKIRLERRQRSAARHDAVPPAIEKIIEHVEAFADQSRRKGR